MFESLPILDNFIVLEGIDGSGTTTQLELLDAELTRASVPHEMTCEPTDGAVGRLIRSVLRGSIRMLPETLALLFAADRREHLYEPVRGIVDLHKSGKLVVSDRYFFSSLAYQSIDINLDAVASLNDRFPLPSHLFFIDIPIEVCMERILSRKSADIFEKRDFQQKVINAYKKTLSMFSLSKMNTHVIDGTLSKDAVFGKIWEIIGALPILGK